MRMQRMKWAAGALALLGFLAISGAGHASCSEINRISESVSGCMESGFDNRCKSQIFGQCLSWSSTFWAEAASECTRGSDKVVVKVDIAGGTDKTWHLYDDTQRSGSASKKVRGVFCCSDLGNC